MAVKSGYNADVYVAALPSVAFTQAATTADGSLTTFTITDTTKRYWDYKAIVTVEASTDGTTWTPVTTGFTIHYVGGVIEFATAQTAGTQIRVSGSYMTSSQLGEAHSWELDLDIDTADKTKFGSQWIDKVPMLKGGSAKLNQWFIDNAMLDELTAATPIILVLYVDHTAGTRYECYAYVQTRALSVAPESIVDTDLTLAIKGEVRFVP